ncbi:AAA family ATPase [Colletotrichum tofieldiae]|uniref:AAA family ATPase n=1 Tax=Colletotrichum tofieldiae TaxID=708197 RepID=A0A166NN32_9PEZI|nr:AAA family ATPase [Colletotrichum tofieldiae]
MTTIDWRAELCNLLDVEISVSDNELLNAKESAIDMLKEAVRLKNLGSEKEGPPKCEIMNRIHCYSMESDVLYLDDPWVVESGPYDAHLRGSRAISHLELHLERNKEITFIVYRNFECCRAPPSTTFTYHGRVANLLNSDLSSFLKSEHIRIVPQELSEGLQEIAYSALDEIPHPRFESPLDADITYPYLWWFHRRQKIDSVIETLGPTFQKHLCVFRQYLQGRLEKEWDTVNSLILQGRITAEYIRYLFVPNSILLSKNEGAKTEQLRGASAVDWLRVNNSTNQAFSATVKASFWEFRGSFRRVQVSLSITEIPKVDSDGSFFIEDLSVYPMEYASEGIVETLRKRGRMFWKCRHRNYVSPSRFSDDVVQASSDSRFMVDFNTYNQMHNQLNEDVGNDDLEPVLMAQDEPDLGDDFFLCLPTSIHGFNMQKKEWVKLEVAFIEDVIWNHQAFEYLVIDDQTKDLVKAVVTTQLRAAENTDLIHGKGNGLFILLHGGPGTGKTLTAESVAEIARKPLYRVTCGDIGTKAEEVEKYLDIVLLLGKTWGCVVLLDEADVFLEERTLKNLERNALVSVFLRVLEYYDGIILILTSNRVGTFDEAFKSRIQLNLRYKNLSEEQRSKIWENFINRIEDMDKRRIVRADAGNNSSDRQDIGVNAEEIRFHIPNLAKTNLNGREIRNVISTARQLAIYRKQPLGYEHIKSVIEEANKFNEYLKELNQGFSADDIRRGQGVR